MQVMLLSLSLSGGGCAAPKEHDTSRVRTACVDNAHQLDRHLLYIVWEAAKGHRHLGRSVAGLGAPNCVFVCQVFKSLGQEPTALLRFRDEVRKFDRGTLEESPPFRLE